MVSRGWQRPDADLYPFNVTQPIPEVPIPLRKGEEEPTISIGDLLEKIYLEMRYDSRIDYSVEPKPRFSKEDTQWVHATLRDAGLRP